MTNKVIIYLKCNSEVFFYENLHDFFIKIYFVGSATVIAKAV